MNILATRKQGFNQNLPFFKIYFYHLLIFHHQKECLLIKRKFSIFGLTIRNKDFKKLYYFEITINEKFKIYSGTHTYLYKVTSKIAIAN